MKAPKPAKRQIYATVMAGGTVLPDGFGQDEMRRTGLVPGTVFRFTASRARDYKQWLKVHRLGMLIGESLDDFNGLDAHAAVKRLQAMAGAECDEFWITSEICARIPRSLAFDEMEAGVFTKCYSLMAQCLIDKYWIGLTEDKITQMASLVGAQHF